MSPGIGEVGQRGQLGADGAADGASRASRRSSTGCRARRTAPGCARRLEAADARHLDVDHPAAPSRIAASTWARLMRALVQADRRLEPGLQIRVIDQAHAVVGQRLLDHGEPIAVELAEELGVGRRVGGVAVDVKREVRKRRPDRLDHVEIPARPELELDAREALVDRALDLLHQDVERVLHAEVGADRDAYRPCRPAPRAAARPGAWRPAPTRRSPARPARTGCPSRSRGGPAGPGPSRCPGRSGGGPGARARCGRRPGCARRSSAGMNGGQLSPQAWCPRPPSAPGSCR